MNCALRINAIAHYRQWDYDKELKRFHNEAFTQAAVKAIAHYLQHMEDEID